MMEMQVCTRCKGRGWYNCEFTDSAWTGEREYHENGRKECRRYVPHIYRGGYVIPHFGYSTERIGRQVTAENAGKPENVR